MAQIPVQSIVGTANPVVFVDVTASDTFDNSQTPSPVLIIRNKNINPRTITFDSPGRCNFGLEAAPQHDSQVVIAGDAGGPGSYTFIRIDPARHNDPLTGLVTMTYSALAGLAVAVVA